MRYRGKHEKGSKPKYTPPPSGTVPANAPTPEQNRRADQIGRGLGQLVLAWLLAVGSIWLVFKLLGA